LKKEGFIQYVMPFLNSFYNIHKIFAEKSIEKTFRLKSTNKLNTSNIIIDTFLKMYHYRYRCYFFSKVSVPNTDIVITFKVSSAHLWLQDWN